MATGDPADSTYIDEIRNNAEFFANDLLNGITSGDQLPQALRDTLLRIPDLDENIGTFRWMRRGNISTDLTSEPEDILESDILTLKTVITDAITNASTPEELETLARFYMISRFDENLNLPEGVTALDQLEIANIKQYLRHITAPGQGGAAPIMGSSVESYVIDGSVVANPVSEEFITSFGDVIERIQTDMRHIGMAPPEGNAALAEISAVGNDRSGHLGEQTARHIEAYIEYTLGENGPDNPGMIQRAEAFKTLLDFYNGLEESDRLAIAESLEHQSGAAPGLMTSPPIETAPEAEASADAPAQPSPEYLAATQVIGNMGAVGQVPPEIIASITNPGRMDQIPAAHLDEAFQQSLNTLITQQEDVTRLWFDSDNRPYEVIENSDGTRSLFRVDPPNNSLSAIPADEIPFLYEYHIEANGQFSRFLLDTDLQTTYSAFADLQPVMLESELSDFDAFHSNFVTQRFLNKIAEESWNDVRRNAGLESMGAAVPDATRINTQLTELEQSIRAQIGTLYSGRGQNLSNANIDAIYADLRTTQPINAQIVQEKFRTQNDAEQTSAHEIATYLIQMQALESFRDIIATRDYSNYLEQGILPDGLHTGRPQINTPWSVDWSDHYRNATMSDDQVFNWDSIQDRRVLPESILSEYNDAFQMGGTIPAALFESSAYAQSYIDQQGWGEELNTTQTAMITRALMMKESADRHGIIDPNSPEARAAFVEDFRAGVYHLHDIDIFMRSFDADGPRRAEILGANDSVEYTQGQFDDAESVRNRSNLFNEAFGVDVALTDAQGNVIATAENSTITRDDAVTMFWQSQARRDPKFERDNAGNAVDYNQSQYHLGYDEMVARHGSDFVEEIERIMETRSLHQQFMVIDANNPAGDMNALYIRRYQANFEDQQEVAFKQEHGIVTPHPESPITAPALDPALDNFIPVPAPAQPQDEPQATEPVEEEESNLRVTPEELRRAANDITMPPPELAVAMGGGMAPSTAPNTLFRPT